jgi:lysophospholipase L1-like esterase
MRRINLWRNSMRCGRLQSKARALFFFLFLFFFSSLTLAHAQAPADDFSLHDGDTVVFYGDSITEQQRYTRDVETFVLTRFPDRHIKFVNAGWNGDRVSGGEGGSIETRLRRDVFPYEPTVVTVMLGMNDGAYTHFDQAAYDKYAKGLTHIVDTLIETLPNVRITLLTPTYYDQNAPWSHHFHGYNRVMLKYGAFVKKLGAERSLTVVDLNAPLHAVTSEGRSRDAKFTVIDDGVHPTEAGHLVIAAALLKAWHAPGLVTDILLDPKKPVTITAPLPWPIPKDARAAQTVSPLPEELNLFRIHAPILGGTRWDLLIDGKSVGTFTRTQLQSGVDLSTLSTVPQNHSSALVLEIVQDKNDRWRYLWKGTPHAIARHDDKPIASEVAALLAVDRWLDDARSAASKAAQAQTHIYSLRPATSLTSRSRR